MGSCNSSSEGQVLSLKDQAAQPYPGPSAQYHFVNVPVTMKAEIFGFIESSVMGSNVDAYYPTLAQQYEQGYRLLSFYHIPGQVQISGSRFSLEAILTFQGIFCRYPQVHSDERFQLRVEKSVIHPQASYSGFINRRTDVVTDSSHLYQTIANNAENGGRLICVELTGQAAATGISFGGPGNIAVGCDLFFDMPMDGIREKYAYNIASVPIHIGLVNGLRPKFKAQCDWQGVFSQYLTQGFKLVEIFMDHTQTVQSTRFSANAVQNSMWFFEKPASLVNDLTPMYEGIVMEHLIHITGSRFGTSAQTKWEPVIQDMGNKGWELACILETNDLLHGFGRKAEMMVMLFFQRKILVH